MERELDESGMTNFDRLREKKEKARKHLEMLREKKNLHVIDAELFFRDAKHRMKAIKNREESKEFKIFHKSLGKTFMTGKPIEVIDGDNDEIDEVSLPEVMRWVQKKR